MTKKSFIFTLIPLAVLMGWSSQESLASSQVPIRIEAESGQLTSPMEVIYHDNVSGDGYIMTKSDKRGKATYQFHIDEAGVYKITAQAYAASIQKNSFYVKINDKPRFVWDVDEQHKDFWYQDNVNNRATGKPEKPEFDPYFFVLTPGEHTISFEGREAGTRLDYFQVEFVKPLETAVVEITEPPASSVRGIFVNLITWMGLGILGCVAFFMIQKRKNVNVAQVGDDVDVRLTHFEHRVNDLQDILLSIDERLDRRLKRT